jgi:hypothetical protein
MLRRLLAMADAPLVQVGANVWRKTQQRGARHSQFN